jgi:hypothetical protein
MRKLDNNLISFTGKDGHIWKNGEILFWGQNHVPGVKRPYYQVMPLKQSGIDDTIKLSGVEDFDLTLSGQVWGGKEDCVDINNKCRDVVVRALDGFRPFGRYACTVKGESRGVRLVGELLSHGKAVDVALGEHSDQARGITTDVRLDLFSRKGPITYWIFNATDPTLEGKGPWKSKFDMPGFFRAPFAWLWRMLKKILPI